MVGIPRRSIHLYRGELRDLLMAALAGAAEQRALVAAFEDRFTRHLGAGIAIPAGSGRLGLRLILQALGIGAGDAVIVPALTDESVPEAIRRAGAEVVWVDVDPRTFNLDPAQLEAVITPRCRAILATHLFGAPCDMAAVEAFAASRGLIVLEDCAHAIDARSAGRPCGTIGRAAIFSFVVTKAINTFGGGMVVTTDDRVARSVRATLDRLPLPDAGALARRIAAGYALNAATRPGVFGALGLPLLRGLRVARGDVLGLYDRVVRPSTVNANVDTAFSPVQAAAGIHQLRHLERTQAARRRAAEAIIEVMPAALRPQRLLPGDSHAWYFLVATADDPDAVSRALLARGVDVGRRPMRNCPALDDPRAADRFPGAEHVVRHAIQLPIHPSLSDAGLARIVEAVASL